MRCLLETTLIAVTAGFCSAFFSEQDEQGEQEEQDEARQILYSLRRQPQRQQRVGEKKLFH